MNQNKRSNKKRLVQVIGLYLFCLLAAVCTWLAVMYAEKKAADSADAATDKTAQTVSYSEEGDVLFL